MAESDPYKYLPAWLVERIAARSTLMVEGTVFPYVVVRHEGASAPRWFIGLDKGSGVFFVSDEVDERFRDHVLTHEMYELGVNEGKGLGRCERALLYELIHCPRELWDKYLPFRLKMFDALLSWIDEVPERRRSYTDEQLREMTMARDLLVKLTRQLI